MTSTTWYDCALKWNRRTVYTEIVSQQTSAQLTKKTRNSPGNIASIFDLGQYFLARIGIDVGLDVESSDYTCECNEDDRFGEDFTGAYPTIHSGHDESRE